jgi:hypothetical protein
MYLTERSYKEVPVICSEDIRLYVYCDNIMHRL